ncbi:MAG: hypothetical protein EU529_13570 [Promethearchaeota archaeon]|nr:MAG: hypothetical protein EU529_13570 [Candidatus Lokiarchaeota archaeon]
MNEFNLDEEEINQLEGEEIINKYYSILKSKNKLIIRFNYWLYAIFAILRIILCFNPFLIFLLILIYIERGISMFFGITSIFTTYLLILIILLLPISLFLGTFRRKKELILDKFSKTLIFNQTTPRFRQLEIIDFQKIEEIIYQDNECGFYLFFILQNSKKRDIFSGSIEDCRKLGRIIAEFLDKPFYYYKYKFIGKSEKISQMR